MKNIISSASKLVFLFITLSACAWFFLWLLSQENFMLLATASFSFYFSNKGSPENNFLDK